MNWFDILKNIQISGQRTMSRNIASPDEEDEDCFKYFYDLVKLMHPDFELQRKLYPDNPFLAEDEDYWCKVKETGWAKLAEGSENETWGIGIDVIEDDYHELMIYYHKVGYYGDNYTAIIIQIPESYDPTHTRQRFMVYSDDYESADSGNARRVDNVAEIWKKIQQHMRSL